MNSVFTLSLDDRASLSVAAQILKANAAGLTIDVGNLPWSGDIISELDGKAARFIFAYGELPVSGEVKPREDKVELRLLIEVGHIPYTVESRERRERLLQVVKSFNGNFPNA